MIKLNSIPMSQQDIDLHLIKPDSLDSPITGPQVFGNKKPLHVEIGCGNGHFLSMRSLKHPDTNFIGIDYSQKRIYKSIYKIKKQDIQNVRFLQGEGKSFLHNHFAEESIQTIYLNFPDPWPKRKHHKNRIYKNQFFDLLYSKLETGGFFYAVSDDKAYFMELLSIIEQDNRFNNTFSSPYQTELEDYEQSLFESRWREMGRVIYYLRYKKQ